MSNIELLDSIHDKILYSKLAESITEQEIEAFIDYKERMKKTYNQAIDEFVELINTMPTYENEYGEIMPMPVEMMAEQLKEKKE